MSRDFSQRHGFDQQEPEITIREDAPDDLRYAVAEFAREAGLSATTIRSVICRVLLTRPNPNNWSEYPNIWDEALGLLDSCDWFKVYDIAESLWRQLERNFEEQTRYQNELNRFFCEKGIGWELKDPDGIVFRGDKAFAESTTGAIQLLEQSERTTAASEIREALQDISRRPKPDRTGAIQHAMAALECVARDVSGQSGTLGQIIPSLALPKPLDTAVDKLWGFASERARHVREGGNVTDEEAELVVGLSGSVAKFLVKRLAQQ